MNWFSFEYPEMVLLLLPLLYCLYRCKEKAMQRYFVHLHFFALKKQWPRLEWLVKVMILVLLVAALASPILIDRSHPNNRMGKDIVLCLDASGSMGASGFEEGTRASRFEIVQNIAKEFVLKRIEDNIGVVLYGDFAFIASPVTYEKEIVSEMIGYLTLGMAGQNTAIGEAIAMGVRAFEHSKSDSKVMVLLTDGEHNSGRISPKEAVELAMERDIIIYTIGMGEKGEFDSALLEEIATQSGGRYFASHSKEELEEVYEQIDALESSQIRSRQYRFKEYFFQYLLAGAALLMLYLMYKRRPL